MCIFRKVIPFFLLGLEDKQKARYPLYQLFKKYANHSGLPGCSESLTERDTNLEKITKFIIPKYMEKVDKEIIFEVCDKKGQTLQCKRHSYYEINWEEVKNLKDDSNHKVFWNLEHFFLSCSLYFDFMPTCSPQENGAVAGLDPSEWVYPLKIKLVLFGHQNASFFIVPKADVWHDYEAPTNRSIYITTLDQDFPGTTHSNVPKQVQKRNCYNFEGYPGICSILHGNGNTERQRNIASHLLAALGDTREECKQPPPSDMKTIRAMVMALAIPFIAEPAPPSDQGITQIHSLHPDLTRKLPDKGQLKRLGGGNPGCHILYKYLLETIKEGTNSFGKVLLHPSHGDKGKPEFLPSKTNGVSEYRASMFSSRDEAILRMQAWLDEV